MAQHKKEIKLSGYGSVLSPVLQSKISVPGLMAVYKVWDTYYDHQDKYHYILLQFQTEKQALEFEKTWLGVKQGGKDKFVFRTLKNTTVSEGGILLRSEFESFSMKFNISRNIETLCGEKVFSEFEKNISLENVEQKYCFYNSVAGFNFNSPKKVEYLVMEEHELLEYKQKFNVCMIGCSPSSYA